jgi:hypothetical protein
MTKLNRHFMAFAALAVSAIGTASGCGGGSSSSASKPLTRAELTAKANAICKRVISQVDWDKVTPQELVHVVGKLASLEEQAASELDKLTPPRSMLAEWRLVVDGFRLTGPEFRRIAQEVEHNPSVYARLPLSNAQHERGLDANIAGIKDCAKY